AVVMRLLAKDPGARFPDAEATIAAIDAAMAPPIDPMKETSSVSMSRPNAVATPIATPPPALFMSEAPPTPPPSSRAARALRDAPAALACVFLLAATFWRMLEPTVPIARLEAGGAILLATARRANAEAATPPPPKPIPPEAAPLRKRLRESAQAKNWS